MQTLNLQLPQGDPPSEFRIFKAGENNTSKGVFFFTERSAQTVMAAAEEWGNEYSLDYEHAAVSEVPVIAPAAGWFNLEIRKGELWAVNVRWTPRALEMLKNREYRYISPAFLYTDEGEIVQLINIGLTNLPATRHLLPLVARHVTAAKGENMNLQNIMVALGLAATASETDANLTALALRNFEREVLSLTGAKSREEAHGVLTAWRESHGQLPKVAERLSALQAETEKRERDAVIAEALRQKKLSPGLKDWAGSVPLETLKTFLSAAPRLIPDETISSETATSQKAWGDMTPAEKHKLYVSDKDAYDLLKAEHKKGLN